MITLAGGTADFEVFKHLTGALRRCLRSLNTSPRAYRTPTTFTSATKRQPGFAPDNSSGGDGDGKYEYTQVPLEQLSLRLHSHSRNPLLSYIHEALSLAK